MVNLGNSGLCCIGLTLALHGKVHLRGSQAYSDSVSSYYAQQASSVQPLCIVKPTQTTDVANAIKLISLASLLLPSADKAQCHFAVRSGGHASIGNAANIANGVTIDLSGLKTISVASNGVTSVGPGATWDEVYEALEPAGLSVAGGRNAGVGVGGLTTGGGISFFSPRKGWTADTVTNYEVVLADGRVVNANSNVNPDLHWALRGGSNNFGVVTRIDLQAFEQGQLWGGMSFYDADQTIDAHIEALAEFSDAATYDEYSSLITSFVLQPGQPPAVATNLEYTKPVVNPASVQGITSIPSLFSSMRLASMSELADELASLQPYGLRQLSATLTHKATVPMLNATWQRWSDSVASVQSIPDLAWSLSLEPLPPAIYAQGGANSNALGLDDRTDSLVVTVLNAAWGSAADDATVNAAARSLIDSLISDAQDLDAYDPFIYLNYAASWQDPIASYGSANVARLRRVRARYDPLKLFTKNVPGGFKLGD
ncbi:putative oxidoreductase [Sodiomyces alkalinus F11]|uniref:Putative oxidoreductase n=1 Tax=Sodiomyces alkalinus (strain CBS 110278 / VKM F-3762 / F11) TaxID=1314773 RepID=A0A3N2Q840_SODAK|nr:putative oxidoreductase [Sodiomyces alkalinus F11]ROT42886.1 putative oxidoreductase [Sodiomyces alkalinus F11]